MNKIVMLHIVSLFIALAGAVLMVGDKITAIPGLNPWLVNNWPTFFFAATMLDRIGKIILNWAKAPGQLAVAIILCFALFSAGCATNTGDPVKDARGRAFNQALIEAGHVLGNVAVASLMNAAQQEMTTGTVDFGHAATQGLFANAPSIFNSGQVDRVVMAYSGSNLPQTAQAAAKAFAQSPMPAQDKANAIAAVISTAAGKPVSTFDLLVAADNSKDHKAAIMP